MGENIPSSPCFCSSEAELDLLHHRVVGLRRRWAGFLWRIQTTGTLGIRLSSG